jgi:GNAT superfamily N-acetyltransferase
MTLAAMEDGLSLVEAPYGSETYVKALRLRDTVLRAPLGIEFTEEELADDAQRRHFCALDGGHVVGSVSFKALGPHTLQLKQMAVAPDRQGERIGVRLLDFAEAWARREGYGTIILNARVGAEGFYARNGYALEGALFEENGIPHVRMTKRVGFA